MSGGAISARLLSAAELVRRGAVLADIGTDHAYLPLFLLSEGRICRAVCTDINKGPLDSARRNVKEAGFESNADFVLCDGAAALADRGITDYTVCGMGGELIASIIDRAPHLKDGGVCLVLGPMTRQGHLRRYLYSAGFEITTESYSFDAGKYYVCFAAKYTGIAREITSLEAEIGLSSSEYVNKDAQIGYLKAKLAAFERALNGKKIGGDDASAEEEIVAGIGARLALLQ